MLRASADSSPRGRTTRSCGRLSREPTHPPSSGRAQIRQEGDFGKVWRMRRTRHVLLPVRSWRYVGLLIVSLACLTLGLVSRDREGHAGSLVGPELGRRAPHEMDACPNVSAITDDACSQPIADNAANTEPIANDRGAETWRNERSPISRGSPSYLSFRSGDRAIGTGRFSNARRADRRDRRSYGGTTERENRQEERRHARRSATRDNQFHLNAIERREDRATKIIALDRRERSVTLADRRAIGSGEARRIGRDSRESSRRSADYNDRNSRRRIDGRARSVEAGIRDWNEGRSDGNRQFRMGSLNRVEDGTIKKRARSVEIGARRSNEGGSASDRMFATRFMNRIGGIARGPIVEPARSVKFDIRRSTVDRKSTARTFAPGIVNRRARSVEFSDRGSSERRSATIREPPTRSLSRVKEMARETIKGQDGSVESRARASKERRSLTNRDSITRRVNSIEDITPENVNRRSRLVESSIRRSRDLKLVRNRDSTTRSANRPNEITPENVNRRSRSVESSIHRSRDLKSVRNRDSTTRSANHANEITPENVNKRSRSVEITGRRSDERKSSKNPKSTTRSVDRVKEITPGIMKKRGRSVEWNERRSASNRESTARSTERRFRDWKSTDILTRRIPNLSATTANRRDSRYTAIGRESLVRSVDRHSPERRAIFAIVRASTDKSDDFSESEQRELRLMHRGGIIRTRRSREIARQSGDSDRQEIVRSLADRKIAEKRFAEGRMLLSSEREASRGSRSVGLQMERYKTRGPAKEFARSRESAVENRRPEARDGSARRSNLRWSISFNGNMKEPVRLTGVSRRRQTRSGPSHGDRLSRNREARSWNGRIFKVAEVTEKMYPMTFHDASEYSTMYDLLRQSVVVALCTVYGLSLYRNKDFLSGIVQRAHRYVAW